jgi:hypothetical protein
VAHCIIRWAYRCAGSVASAFLRTPAERRGTWYLARDDGFRSAFIQDSGSRIRSRLDAYRVSTIDWGEGSSDRPDEAGQGASDWPELRRQR